MSGYEVRESGRAKRLSVAVHPDGRVVLVKPVRTSLATAERFLAAHADWIERAVERMLRAAARTGPRTPLPRPREGSRAYREAREAARALVHARLQHFAAAYGFRYGTVSIRDQRTRWGSCSAAGNLSFNYRIAFLPPALQDYVVVHELCHTEEHNHSPRFWALVARKVPEHAALRKRLRAYG